MSYKIYFVKELRKRILLLPIILLIIAVLWFIDSEVNILNISFMLLLLILFLGALGAAFIKYKNNGKDLWGNY